MKDLNACFLVLMFTEFKTSDQAVTPHAGCLLRWRLGIIISLDLILMTDVRVGYT